MRLVANAERGSDAAEVLDRDLKGRALGSQAGPAGRVMR